MPQRISCGESNRLTVGYAGGIMRGHKAISSGRQQLYSCGITDG
ncbi:MAG: hypothetical protein ACFCAD_10940 [Pleurocapsa sp.]